MTQQASFLTDEELLNILEVRIPALLERHPELQWRVYAAFLATFARREEVAAIMAELREFRQETVQRLDQIDQRFEQIDQRFDQIDQRFDQMDKHFEDLRNWVELVIGRAQVRSGHNLEDVVAAALRVALKCPDIRAESIRLRQKIVDTDGLVFPRGRQKEVDLIATDDEYIAFEVKSAAEVEDVEDFAEKVELLRLLNPDKKVRGVFVTLAPEPDIRQRCEELGIELAK